VNQINTNHNSVIIILIILVLFAIGALGGLTLFTQIV
jgi:flagellar basal body-associated protein FliL